MRPCQKSATPAEFRSHFVSVGTTAGMTPTNEAMIQNGMDYIEVGTSSIHFLDSLAPALNGSFYSVTSCIHSVPTGQTAVSVVVTWIMD